MHVHGDKLKLPDFERFLQCTSYFAADVRISSC
jgi:hypothetical protein